MAKIKALVLMNPYITFDEQLMAVFSQEIAQVFDENGQYDFQIKQPEQLTDQDFAETEALVAIPSPDLLPKFKKLRWLQLFSAGTNGYTEGADFPENVQLTNATGTYGLTISEHLLTMALVLARRFNVYAEQQNQQIWQNAGRIQSIYGSTVLVHGLGDIGGHFAAQMKALGAHVIAVKHHIYGDEKNADEVYTDADLDKVLPRADIIASSVPGTKATYKIFNSERFALMKPTAIFLNVGRGTNVDLEALCDALDSGKLWGAGLDVTDPEPLPAGHRAWTTENLIITPHSSGGYTLPESRRRFLAILAENLEKFASQQPLINQVDMATGYRKHQG